MGNWVKPLVDMELDDEDKLDLARPTCGKPDYPYGLRICLTHTELAKLGLDHEAAFVGGTVHGFFMGQITSVSMNDSMESLDGPSCKVEIQIQQLGLESEDEEDAEEEKVMPVKRKGLYRPR